MLLTSEETDTDSDFNCKLRLIKSCCCFHLQVYVFNVCGCLGLHRVLILFHSMALRLWLHGKKTLAKIFEIVKKLLFHDSIYTNCKQRTCHQNKAIR